MTAIPALFDLPKMTPHAPKGLKETDIWNIPSKEVVGIEVEAENAGGVDGLNNLWRITEDGSLRNSGREFITLPIEACHAPAALQNLLGGSHFCFSPRTSVHVHLNCMDLEAIQVVNILLLYSLYEKPLYRFVGRSRWKNIYCTPITETNLLFGLERYGVKAPWEKYTGLNILPLHDHGTIEFRHMHGTTDVKKLSIWIDLITRLKEYVKAHSTDEIRKKINAFSEADINETAYAIWGDVAGHLAISDPDEVLSRVPIVKLAVSKCQATNNAVNKLITTTTKYFQI